MRIRAPQTVLPYWRGGPVVALAGLSIALSIFTGRTVARSEPALSPQLIILLALAGALILLSLGAEILFLSWLALAPLLQGSADATAVGHMLALGLYVAPPLVLVLWTVTRWSGDASPHFVDTLPALFFLYMLGSLVLSGDASSTSLKAVYTTIGIGIVLYYFFAFGPIGALSWEKISALLLLVCAVQGVMSIIDSLASWNLWHDNRWQESFPRAVATLDNPGVLGTFIGMGVVLAVSILVWRGPSRLRTLAVATIAVGLPGVFLTYTRAPILATIILGALVLASRAQTRVIALGALILAVVVVALSWGRITDSSVYSERVTNSSNIQSRALIQNWSLELAAERPLFGWGFGSFDRVKNSAGLSSGEIPRAFGIGSTSHNTYLTILVEFGGIGLALLLVPWLVITGRALKVALARPELRWFLVGSIAAIAVYVLVANTLDMRFFSFVPALPWLFLGLLRRGHNVGGVAAFASR